MSDSKIEIQKLGTSPSVQGPAEYFSGNARIEMLYTETPPFRSGAAQVTFEPGARTAWHTHPLGQRLIITSGVGWVQEEGFDKQVVKSGDVVWFPPHIKHWHGATDKNAMSHIAIQEAENGKAVEWLELVSDEDYKG